MGVRLVGGAPPAAGKADQEVAKGGSTTDPDTAGLPMPSDQERQPEADEDESLLVDLLRRSPRVFIKKLSNNDRDWAQRTEKHQGGVYVPAEQRESGFFPPLAAKQRPDPAADTIREVFFPTDWPQFGIGRRTRLVHYTSKGPETHLTGVPREAFADLSPASWLVMAPHERGGASGYVCLTIDSNSTAAEVLRDALALGADFVAGVLEPAAVLAGERERILDFAERVAMAWTTGRIADFAEEEAGIPATVELAAMARHRWLEPRGLASLDPFVIERPGDAVREISREIEWGLFRNLQQRETAVRLVRSVFGDEAVRLDMKGVIRRLVDAVAEVDRIMLSAGQQRKSRAGYSFEHHIEAMLEAGRIPFAKQVVIEARKRPDFILPSREYLDAPPAGAARGLILSAKTTLRERWKQVQREMAGRDLFLATVDEGIAANAIEDMASMGIVLVVPEKLKKSKDTEYVRHDNVVDFGRFFREELKQRRMSRWL